MSDHIPQEVITNILLRLRVKDLFTCRCVSKLWLLIIDDPHFISLQLQRSISTNSNAALFLQDRESPTLYWKQKYDRDISFFSNPIHYEPSEVLLMGSCHGLVCFSFCNNPHPHDFFSLCNHPHDFVVLNPSTREQHTVSIPMEERRLGDKLVGCGFGNDKSSDDYKVVKIIETEMRHVYPYPSPSFRAEIYCIRSKWVSWTIPLPHAYWNCCVHKFIGVFFCGSLHWCTSHWTDSIKMQNHVIHVIDLGSNTYRQLQCPDYSNVSSSVDLNVGIVDTRLCLFGSLNDAGKIGIWAMEEYGNPESWSRIYSVQYVSDYWFPFSVLPSSVFPVGSNGDEILLMLGWDTFAWCDPTNNEDETFLTDDAYWRYGSYEAVYCLESLVKIFPCQPSYEREDAYQEVQLNGHPGFLDLRKLKALMYEDYYEHHSSDDED
ncbi:F-box protein CPR1 [Linum perenne]